MVFIGYIIFYILLGLYLLRPIPNSYDLLKIRIRFLPFNAKWIGVLVIIAGIFVSFYCKDLEGFVRKRELFFYNLNTGLLLFIFSKERTEDELILHLRLKSLVISFINTTISVGVLYPLFFLNNEITDNGFLGFGLFWLMLQVYYLVYFYYSIYKSQKEQL